MNVASMGPGLHPATTPQRCLCQRVACTPDAISAPTTGYSPALQRPVSKQRVTSPISQLAGVQQDHPGVWPSQPAPQIDRVAQRPPPPPQQQQHFQDTLQQAAALSAPDAAAGSDRGSSVTTGSSGVQQSATTPGPGKQQAVRHKQHHTGTTQLASSMQPQPAAPRRPPCKYTPCGKRDGQKLAASVSSRLQRGQQVLLPAGTGMQLVRTTAMLSSARSMLLSRDSSTGLVFQPSFSAASGAAAMAAHQQQAERRQRARTAVAGSGYASSQLQQASAGGDMGAHVPSSNGNSSSSSSKGVMLLVASVAEAQLRRFDQRPLIAARSTRAAALAAVAFARLCKQGYTSVRAAGPEATRLAMLAAAEARSKLLGCGLDLAVVPATDQVDIESLAGPAGSSQYLDVEGVAPGEELPKQFVQVTVLHLVRCEPQQPGRLLPWPVPAEQLPEARHRRQQQQQQQVAALPAQQSRDMSSQQQVGAWRSGLLAAGAQQAPQQPAGPGGYQEHPAAPHLQPLPVLATGGSSSSSSSDPLLAHAANSVVPSSPLLLPRQQSGAAAGWSAAAGGCDEDVLLGAADQLPSLQHDAAALPSQASSMGRQAGGLLLQHKAHSKKGSRQLVAAAQAGSNTGSRGSSS